MTPFFQSDSRVLAMVRDLTFNRARIVPYLHREMLRTLGVDGTRLRSASSSESVPVDTNGNTDISRRAS